MSIKKLLPWYFRIIIKLILSRIPFSYTVWSRIGFFRHGAMDDFNYAWDVLKSHKNSVNVKDGWYGLELGPGDGLLSAFLVSNLNSSGLVMVDAGDYAHKNIQKYIKQIENFRLSYPNSQVQKISNNLSIDELLSSRGSAYHSKGLESLRILESNSFDLIFSQAVLEHIRCNEFYATMKECYRLLKKGAVMSHVVDFKDHLGGGLNNMRIPSAIWEKNWFAPKSGFYTNRLRFSEMISICNDIGFEVEIKSIRKWDSLTIERQALAKEFTQLTEDDLLISGAHLIMYRRDS